MFDHNTSQWSIPLHRRCKLLLSYPVDCMSVTSTKLSSIFSEFSTDVSIRIRLQTCLYDCNDPHRLSISYCSYSRTDFALIKLFPPKINYDLVDVPIMGNGFNETDTRSIYIIRKSECVHQASGSLTTFSCKFAPSIS